MPLSEIHPAPRNKLDSKMNNACLPSSVPDGELVELLWKDGQIVMQGQPSRSKKNSIPTFSSQPTKLQEKEDEDCVLENVCHLGVTDSVADDFSATSPQMGSNAQDDDMFTWLNYPVDDYSLEFLSEFSGVNTSALPVHNNSMTADKGSGQVPRDSHSLDHNLSPRPVNGSPDSRLKAIEFNHTPRQSRASDIAAGFTTTPVCRNASNCRLPGAKLQRQDPVSPKPPPPPPRSTGGSGLLNFSHFTRPVSLLKANHESGERLRSNEKASTTAASAVPVGSTLIASSGAFKNVSQRGLLALVSDKGDVQSTAQPQTEILSVKHSAAQREMALVSDKDDVKSTTQPRTELISFKHSEATNWGNASRDDNISADKCMSPDRVCAKGFSTSASLPGSSYSTRNSNSEMVAASSVCSASGAYAMPVDTKQRDKRKIPEGEESGYQSEGIDDDSTVVKKVAGSSGNPTKRRRAAEVHNLSERRRRDRINVKMRALQELIPNCNKVDKASMLDEAIEYLKTLQLQVQIMSMGGGLCMPPMMLPPALQHLRTPHMARHYPPMGGGMGMGYGMGILDMIPQMQGPQFSCSVPGNLGMPGSDGLRQMLGIPCQGQSVPIACAPQTGANTMPQVPGMQAASLRDAQITFTPCDGLKDQQMQNLNLDAAHKVGIDDRTHIQSCKQATQECRAESSTVPITINASHSGGGDRPLNSTSWNGNSSTGGTS